MEAERGGSPTLSTKFSSSTGILCGDILDNVFAILRTEEISYWDRHRRFEGDQRNLSTCALVSRTWRDLAICHLFHDLIFTHGPVIDGACVDASHKRKCALCYCSCHFEDHEGVRKEILMLLDFLQGAPHVRMATRSLRLRMSPLATRSLRLRMPLQAVPQSLDSENTLDPVVLFEIFECLPQLKRIFLEDIVLQTKSTPVPPQRLSIEELAFNSWPWRGRDTTIQRIIQHFRHIGRLRFSSRLNGMPLDFLAVFTSIGLGSDIHDASSASIPSLLASSERGPTSLEIGAPVAEDISLQKLLNTRGHRLHHFVYLSSMPVVVIGSGSRFQSCVQGYNLSRCSNLQSFYTNVDMASIDVDLREMVCPTLSSLQKSPYTCFRQIVITSWVFQKPGYYHLEQESVRQALHQLQETVLQLQDWRGLSDVVFRLVYGSDDQYLIRAYTDILTNALHKLSTSGLLRIVSKNLDVRSISEQGREVSDAIMSIVCERI